jgi:ATPase subunit of ABC transporter with duplicated ATPase domains
MSFIKFSDLAFSHAGGPLLFEDASIQLAPGDHAALIGDNGVGKSTLLAIIAGHLTPDSGDVKLGGDAGFMAQDVGFAPTGTVRSMLLEIAPPDLRKVGTSLDLAEVRLEAGDTQAGMQMGELLGAWQDLGGYQLEAAWDVVTRRVLGIGVDEIAGRSAEALSGGERKRLLLECLFDGEAPVLLLDEPDNYLDVMGKEWLERRIRESDKTILLVSHDRILLTNAVTKIITLESGGCWVHGASYATYPAAREHRQELLGDALQRWKDEERRLYRHYKVMKQRAALNDKNAASANAAESRWRRFVDAGPPPPPAPKQAVVFRLEGSDSGRVVLRCTGLSVPDLLGPFDWELRFGERVGLIGPNGAGKTRLLHLLATPASAPEGQVRLGSRVRTGLFTQINDSPRLRGRRIADILLETLGNYEDMMRTLGRYGLQGTVNRPYETLSGGQRARLEVLLLELEGSNLLLLDEPTDNLDIDSAEALEQALGSFRGTVVSVTHDRAFLKLMDEYLFVSRSGLLYSIPDYDFALRAMTRREGAEGLRLARLLTRQPATSRRRS